MALRKYSTTFLMSTSATDARQTPAYSASVEVYRQGAKVTADTPVLVTATAINIRSAGAIVVGDVLQAGTDTTRRVTVTVVTSGTSITATAVGISTVQLLANERLVVVSAPLPILYNNDASAGTPIANPATSDSQGYVEFYTPDSPFDLIVRRTGMNPEVYEDQESGAVATTTAVQRDYFNVMDYADVATALTEIPAGARLYFPAAEGPFTPPTAAGWTIAKPVTIYSDGPSIGEDKGFQYFNAHKDSTIFNVDVAAVRNVIFRDTCMSNNAGVPAASGTGDAIRFVGAGTMTGIQIDNCWILSAGRSGLYINGTNVVGLSITNSRFQNCGGHGVFAYATNFIRMFASDCGGNQGMGGVFASCGNGNSWVGCNFEGNGGRLSGAGAGTIASTIPQDYGPTISGQLLVMNSDGAVVGCNIEDITGGNFAFCRIAVSLNLAHGVTVGGCEMDDPGDLAGTIGVQIVGGSTGCAILPNRMAGIDVAVNVAAVAADYGNVIYPQSIGNPTANCPGRIVQPANGRNWIYVTDRPSGLSSNEGVGMLFPSLAASAGGISTADADTTITTAAFEGLTVYNSNDNKLYVLTAANTWTPQT